jgi:hypothetical protein
MTAEPLLALPRPAQSGRVSSPRPAASTAIPRARQDWRASSGHERTAGRKWSTTRAIPQTRAIRVCRPLPKWTHFGREVDAHTRDRPSPRCQKTYKLQAKPSVGLEPTTPSLPWKDGGVSGVHRCSPAGTKCLQIARSRSERSRRPKTGRGETGGRNVDGKPATPRRRISRADLGLTRLIVSGPLGPPDAG